MLVLPVIAVGGLAALAYRFGKRKGKMTSERQRIYVALMNSPELTPEQIRTMADVFQKEGLEQHATILRKRADLKEMPAELKLARSEVYKKAMSSTNKAGIYHVADAFESEGALGAAESLRRYADGLTEG